MLFLLMLMGIGYTFIIKLGVYYYYRALGRPASQALIIVVGLVLGACAAWPFASYMANVVGWGTTLWQVGALSIVYAAGSVLWEKKQLGL